MFSKMVEKHNLGGQGVQYSGSSGICNDSDFATLVWANLLQHHVELNSMEGKIASLIFWRQSDWS